MKSNKSKNKTSTAAEPKVKRAAVKKTASKSKVKTEAPAPENKKTTRTKSSSAVAKKSSVKAKPKTTVKSKTTAPTKTAKKASSKAISKKEVAKVRLEKKELGSLSTKKATKIKKPRTTKSASVKRPSKSNTFKGKPASAATLALLDAIVNGLQNKKAQNIVTINLQNIEDAVAEFFVICHGDASIHVKGLADSVVENVQLQVGEKPWHTEGYDNLEWVIVDYVNIVVHIFKEDIRKHYNLEEIWGDGEFSQI